MNTPRARLLAAGLAAGALAAPATAAAVPVHVRVEGTQRTLLPDTRVTTNPGRIVGLTGNPTCSGGSALGALDAATRGRWTGSYFEGLGYSPETILGEAHPFSGTDYYAFYVNHAAAAEGVCSTTPKAGDEILFAVAPATPTTPGTLAVTAPKRVRAGHAIRVKVTKYTPAGKGSAAAGVRIRGGGLHGRTAKNGRVRLIAEHPGVVDLQAAKKGFVRDEATVRVRRSGA